LNVLAHLYLSGNHKQVMTGNYLGDFVRSSQFREFSDDVVFGIELHHAIDTYTDAHPTVQKSKELCRAAFSKYATVVVDIYYDHFLAKHWGTFHTDSLQSFATQSYEVLGSQQTLFPQKAKRFYNYLSEHDVLQGYADFKRLEQVFFGMSRRASFESNMEQGVEVLYEHYTALQEQFFVFMKDLNAFVSKQNPHFKYAQ